MKRTRRPQYQSDDDVSAGGSDNEDAQVEVPTSDVDGADGGDSDAKSDDSGTPAVNKSLLAMRTAMSSILEKKLSAEVPVLAKRRTAVMKQVDKEKEELHQKKESARERKRARNAFLAPTEVTHRNAFEKQLRRIATRGVVKLFNAISQHQKQLNKEAAEAKAKAAPKSKFTDLLKTSAEQTTGGAAAGSEGSGQWGVLQDNYMMGARMKDWGVEDSEDEEATGAAEAAEWNAAAVNDLGSDSDMSD